MEVFAKPGVGGIIIKTIDEIEYILIQERCKEDGGAENGLIEIPAGKIREFENIFDCLRREIWEETGLTVTEIEGENDTVIIEANGYKAINYMPFACAQNIDGNYPIMVQTFICKAQGKILDETNETKNIRWVSLNELKDMLDNNEEDFYPMHIMALKKYLKLKLIKKAK
ncbi:NUDIX domain-containing protein [Clostridium aestuarii]|uniref:NUDIX domain-containing protein n=1 Tax=Clostridium aestuarii TaxID=338193 RepID=A0ABT4D049_9CLOT|nr:NUDIX domain-containing protein [Clostridium aestuarii]MCY6483428.1 NUDIX domain-containing protein [Clostridium aestuarii]